MVDVVKIRKNLKPLIEDKLKERDELGLAKWRNTSEFVNEAIREYLKQLDGEGGETDE